MRRCGKSCTENTILQNKNLQKDFLRKIYTGDARESRKIQEDKLVFTGLFYYELYPVELTKRAKKEYKEPFKGSDEPTGKPAFLRVGR